MQSAPKVCMVVNPTPVSVTKAQAEGAIEPPFIPPVAVAAKDPTTKTAKPPIKLAGPATADTFRPVDFVALAAR